MGLHEYQRKRSFGKTPEPRGESHSRNGRLYVVHKHAASRLHYDFRIELDGVLKSWAVPKGPSLHPSQKRLAVHVEDHPVEYGSFEGTIPKGEYGGGTVMLWDRGTWIPRGDPGRSYQKGRLTFSLKGKKLKGGWSLIRMGGSAEKDGKNWLLIKDKDSEAIQGKQSDVGDRHPLSVATKRSLEEISQADNQDDLKGFSSTSGKNVPQTKTSSSKRSKATTHSPADPLRLPNAILSSQPTSIHPQLATLVKQVPLGAEWLHEIKFDGYRLLTFVNHGKIKLLTRNGKDWTRKFQAIAQALAELPVHQAILDGEVVALGSDGISDFQALQNVLKGEESALLVYYLFDLPFYEGYNLCRIPLLKRKELLEHLWKDLPSHAAHLLRYSDHIQGQGELSFRHACQKDLEGIISKKATSSYQQSRSKNWVKVKCQHRQEFVIAGYTSPGGSRKYFGALLLGYYDQHQKLQFAGRVGTGFSEQTLKRIYQSLAKRKQSRSPFAEELSRSEIKGVHWVRPDLVAEVEFFQWTRDGHLRHPAFIGLREEKSAHEIGRELPVPIEDSPTPREENLTMKAKRTRSSKRTTNSSSRRRTASRITNTKKKSGIPLSNPDRILYPKQGITKRQLAEYYQQIAEWVLPHVTGRPLTLVRCPEGFQKTCFYQRHASESLPDSIHPIPIQARGKKEEKSYLAIRDLKGLLALVQMGVLEIHPWGCKEDRTDRPDRLIFDIDPGPGVPWERIIECAHLLKDRLAQDGLKSFVKTSGGKGLHVMAPLVRRASWDTLKNYTKKLATELAKEHPDRFVATMSKSKRQGKIFIDYLRNGFGSTCITAYGTRARHGAPVSTPVRWDELSSLPGPEAYTLTSLPRRLATLREDPWTGFFDLRQSLPSSATAS